MKVEVINPSTEKTIKIYSVPDLSMLDFQEWKDESEVVVQLNCLYDTVSNLNSSDIETNEPTYLAPRVDFYLPNPLKDQMLSQFAELHPDTQELSDQLADGLNEGPYLKLSTVLSAVVTEISRNHQPHTDYQVRISDE